MEYEFVEVIQTDFKSIVSHKNRYIVFGDTLELSVLEMAVDTKQDYDIV